MRYPVQWTLHFDCKFSRDSLFAYTRWPIFIVNSYSQTASFRGTVANVFLHHIKNNLCQNNFFCKKLRNLNIYTVSQSYKLYSEKTFSILEQEKNNNFCTTKKTYRVTLNFTNFQYFLVIHVERRVFQIIFLFKKIDK